MNESSCCSTSSPAFGVVSILDFGLCNRHVVVSRLHFPNDIQCRAPFHILICHLYIFFGEMSVQAFCPVFKSGFSFSCCWVLRGLCIFWIRLLYQFSSLQFSHSVGSHSLRPHELQHARPPYPSPTPGVHSDSCLSSQWCHPAIWSSVVPFSSCPQSLPASGSFPVSWPFTSSGQSIRASASFSPKNPRADLL